MNIDVKVKYQLENRSRFFLNIANSRIGKDNKKVYVEKIYIPYG